jgi:hypothetical protein
MTGIITTALPSYAGQIFTSDPKNTPFLTRIGGINGGKVTQNYEFTTGQHYNLPDPEIPEISEIASLTAPAPSHVKRSQLKNVTQIFHETVAISYVKQSNQGRMSGLNTAGQEPNPQDELAWQTDARLKKIARDMEHTFLYGKYHLSDKDDEPNKTRGMFEAIVSNFINANGSKLTYSMLKALYLLMAQNGAQFEQMELYCGAYQKQAITEIYKDITGFVLPASRTEGGVNIQDVTFDFGTLSVIYDPFFKDSEIGLFDMKYIDVVTQPTPGKGNFFREELAKTGAGEKHQIFGQAGLDHGPEFAHGKIFNLI